MGTTPISVLASQVINRLEETDPPIFWNKSRELYTGIVEAMCDLLLLVGRPDLAVNQPFTLTPNSVWQNLPKSAFLITDIQGASSSLYKTSLYAMDYVQSSWTGDWENDISDTPIRWFPVGFYTFGIHPAVSVPVQVMLTTISLPTISPWPYDGTQVVPFHDEFFVAVETYAAVYARTKETGQELQEAMSLYQQYLTMAKRMSSIEDRKDNVLFSTALGAAGGVNPVTKR